MDAISLYTMISPFGCVRNAIKSWYIRVSHNCEGDGCGSLNLANNEYHRQGVPSMVRAMKYQICYMGYVFANGVCYRYNLYTRISSVVKVI